MRLPRPEPGALARVCLLFLAVGSELRAQQAEGILHTKHNLSLSGPGPIRALTENRICVFCHAPHNATPLSPLWNRELEPQVYTVYASPTLRAGPLAQPTGATKLCLSCHDGTIAMGAVVNPAGGISMAGGASLPPGSLADFGPDLSGHHPVSFSYQSALPNLELQPSPPADLTYGGTDEVQCTTCHDPHSDLYGKFLVKDHRDSQLCTSCHVIPGWVGSAHESSTASVVGILPRPPKTWPQWTELHEWGCEACHTPHFAPTPEQLLNFTTAPPAPFSCTTSGCHTSDPGTPHVAGGVVRSGPAGSTSSPDIARQVRKFSGHHEPVGTFARAMRNPGGAARSGIRSISCADCHNPHALDERRAEAPYVSGMLGRVSGLDRNGAEVQVATFEYEVCFKCHADNTPDLDYVPRVVEETNTRAAFDPANPSFHPVVAVGRNLEVPSIPSSFEPSLQPSRMIFCTDCHADDEGGSRGPHGSSYAPILRERYDLADNTPESYESYALCYRCHDRTSILGDRSFRRSVRGGGHSGHLSSGAACAACHDPHGVSETSPAAVLGSGSHTHLINFDTRTVLPLPGSRFPTFEDTGQFSGSCTLVCHGVAHEHLAYP